MIFFEFELKRIVICMVCFLCFIGFHVYPWWFNTMYLYKTVCWCIVLAHCHVESTSQTKPLVIYKNLIPIKSKFTGTKIWLKGVSTEKFSSWLTKSKFTNICVTSPYMHLKAVTYFIICCLLNSWLLSFALFNKSNYRITP